MGWARYVPSECPVSATFLVLYFDKPVRTAASTALAELSTECPSALAHASMIFRANIRGMSVPETVVGFDGGADSREQRRPKRLEVEVDARDHGQTSNLRASVKPKWFEPARVETDIFEESLP